MIAPGGLARQTAGEAARVRNESDAVQRPDPLLGIGQNSGIHTPGALTQVAVRQEAAGLVGSHRQRGSEQFGAQALLLRSRLRAGHGRQPDGGGERH